MQTNWDIAERKYDDIIKQLLYTRGILEQGEEAKDTFLDPDFSDDLADHSLLPGLDVAVERIGRAIAAKEKIGIFADYDADGTPGAALLFRAFRKLGVESEIFIPSRQEDGYGLNVKGIDYLFGKGCSLIVTIDLGIRSNAEALYCKERGIDLIITDHHLPGDEVPEALAVVNPKLGSPESPLFDLCGCGVAYKLICGLSREHDAISEAFLKWNLDLVAISTIADMVPLLKENRILAKYGLKVLRKTKNLGIEALITSARIAREKIDPYVVGFQIGPRINTPGRIDHATKSFELLVAEDKQEARTMAAALNEMNLERQQEMDRVFAEAVDQIEAHKLYEQSVLIVAGDWPKGVLGPPASRLVEKYYRPAIVFSESESELTGSARSVAGVHILELIESVAPYVEKYGGHKGAAGLSISREKYGAFKKALQKSARQLIKPDNLIKRTRIDLKVGAEELTRKLYNDLEKLEPFGLGNPRPVFLVEGAAIMQPRYVGDGGKHLSCQIRQGSVQHKSIFFNCDSERLCVKSDTMYDIVFSLNLDTWNGQEKLSLQIIDAREH